MKFKASSIICICLFFSLCLFFSCKSTNIKNEPGSAKNKETSLNNKTEINDDSENFCDAEDLAKSAEQIFIEEIQNIQINVVSSPKMINKNNIFSSAFEFQVVSGDNPVSNFNITLTFPSGRNEKGEIIYSSQDFITDENGKISFMPEKQIFACSDFVYAFPAILPECDSDDVKNAVESKKVSSPWLVRSDIIYKGAVLFVWDYNEKNRAVNNSYELLAEFRNRGMSMVGNAPVNEPEYIEKSLNFLYKENYEIIENSYGYLICGTVKFTKPVEPCDEGYLCSLISQINVVEMKTGNLVFSKSFEQQETGKNWNVCVSKCKSQLSKKIVDEILFSL